MHPAPQTCTMPGHGRADAPHACCRPAAASLPPPATSFWADAGTWWRAARNTAHCLLGCALGDIAAMALVPLLWPGVPAPALLAIAIIAGLASSLLLETLVLRLREGFAWRPALATALRMSLISMVGMELAMNAVDWIAMGGVRLPLHHGGFWLAWIPGLIAGFLAPLPYNYAQLRKHGRSCH